MVSPEVITQIIEAGRLTPSGKNAQDVSYIVLRNHMEHYEKIAIRLFRRLMPLVKLVSPMARNQQIDDHFFFKKAPVAVMIVSKDKINGTLAASNMALMAEACGLSSYSTKRVSRCPYIVTVPSYLKVSLVRLLKE